MGKTIAISTQTGGVGKAVSAVSLGIGLARQGKRVLCLDADPQHSLSVSLGISEPDKLPVTLAPIFGRETIVRQYIDMVKPNYDYIIVDCPPSLGLLTVNALTAADSVIIPVAPKYLDTKGLELFLKTVVKVRRQLNPHLEISGILLTMVDRRANFTREIISLVESTYGSNIRIFGEHIPRSVRNLQRAAAYGALTREVLSDAA